MTMNSAIVGDLVTNTGPMWSTDVINVGGMWTDARWPQPWTPLVQPWPWGSVTITTVTDPTIHHVAFPLKAGTKSPCGAELVSAHGTTGIKASSDLGQVTCLLCLRALARAAR